MRQIFKCDPFPKNPILLCTSNMHLHNLCKLFNLVLFCSCYAFQSMESFQIISSDDVYMVDEPEVSEQQPSVGASVESSGPEVPVLSHKDKKRAPSTSELPKTPSCKRQRIGPLTISAADRAAEFGEPLYAVAEKLHCRLCKTSISTVRSTIVNHSKSSKHLKALEMERRAKQRQLTVISFLEVQFGLSLY